MGNCMESWKGEENTKELGSVKDEGFVKEVEKNKNGVRVKMLLTKEELQWLMMHLSNRDQSGAKRIEDVLGEIEKGRKKVVVDHHHNNHGWKPSLDSITEIPEVLEMNRL